MTAPLWIDLGPIEDFPDNVHACVTVQEEPVVVMNAGGTIYAVQDRCPHARMPIGDGERAGLILTCPHHGYAFNIKTGMNVDAPDDDMPIKTYPVRVESGRVSIQLNHDDQDEA